MFQQPWILALFALLMFGFGYAMVPFYKKFCEVTGITWTPDGRTLFLNIQHPGEGAGERLTPQNPRQHSNWPDFRPDGRPRSATVVVRRRDGGVIGA